MRVINEVGEWAKGGSWEQRKRSEGTWWALKDEGNAARNDFCHLVQ